MCFYLFGVPQFSAEERTAGQKKWIERRAIKYSTLTCAWYIYNMPINHKEPAISLRTLAGIKYGTKHGIKLLRRHQDGND